MDLYNWDYNTLNISFPYEYLISTVKINWHDLNFAIKYRFVDFKSSVDYAIKELEKNDASNEVLELCLLYFKENIFLRDVEPYINALSASVSQKEKDKTEEKIMYVLLKWTYENRDNFKDPLEVVEFIYDDFKFPESIKEFVRCPFAKKSTSSLVENYPDDLYNKWELFLKNQQNKWKE